MSHSSSVAEPEILAELCRKHGLEPKLLEELIKIEKRCQHMERRHGIFDELKRSIENSIRAEGSFDE